MNSAVYIGSEKEVAGCVCAEKGWGPVKEQKAQWPEPGVTSGISQAYPGFLGLCLLFDLAKITGTKGMKIEWRAQETDRKR